jgi:hypothetical protein
MKKIIKIKLDEQIKTHFLNFKYYYSFQSLEHFISYFVPDIFEWLIVSNDEKSDITFWDIQTKDNSRMKSNEINILLSLENIEKHRDYFHYKKYNYYNNDRIKVYYYNHISKIKYINNTMSIPTIYFFIDFYKKNKNLIKPNVFTKFVNKRFCLVIRKNPDIYSRKIIEKLEYIGLVDNISLYEDVILEKSCYHSVELLNIFNKYKFILCFENSFSDGYITEKIFNCFYSESIPLYKGAFDVNNYFNDKSFINFNNENDMDNNIEYIKKIYSNKNLYEQLIKIDKIKNTYDDEKYQDKFNNFISELKSI